MYGAVEEGNVRATVGGSNYNPGREQWCNVLKFGAVLLVGAACGALLTTGGLSTPASVPDGQELGLSGEASLKEKNVFFLTDMHVEPFFDRSSGEYFSVKRNHLKATADVKKQDRFDFSSSKCRVPACQAPSKHDVDPGLPICVANFTESDLELMPLQGCDAPLSLLEATLEYMKAIDPSPAAILLGGDLPAHSIVDLAQLAAAQRVVLERIANAFPSTPVVYAVGNNDLLDARQTTEKGKAEEYERLWRLLAGEKELEREDAAAVAAGILGDGVSLTTADGILSDPKNEATFKAGGYYAYRLPLVRCRVLSINSLMFLAKPPLASPSTIAPLSQLEWMAEQLQEAEAGGEAVLLIGHIPPGLVGFKFEWLPEYLEEYISLCSQFAHVIVAQNYGHHSKELVRSLAADVGAFVSVGLTPQGGGDPRKVQKEKQAVNPGFAQLKLKLDLGEREGGEKGPRSHLLADLITHYLDIKSVPDAPSAEPASISSALVSAWKPLYSFKDTYATPDASAPSIALASAELDRDPFLAAHYTALIRGLYRTDVLQLCDTQAVGTKQSVEDCVARACRNDVSIQCYKDMA